MNKLVAKVRPTAALRHPLAHTGGNERRLVEPAASQIQTRTVGKSTDRRRSLFHLDGYACSDERRDHLRCRRPLIVSWLDRTPPGLIALQPHSKTSLFSGKTQNMNWAAPQCEGYAHAYGPLL
jgi:hypothetical protein